VAQNGAVLPVETFNSTNQAIRCDRLLGKKTRLRKVTKRIPDMRFGLPIIGIETLGVRGQSEIARRRGQTGPHASS
jgi:DUF1009 family protein